MSTLREPLARPTPQKQGASAWLQHNLITGGADPAPYSIAKEHDTSEVKRFPRANTTAKLGQ